MERHVLKIKLKPSGTKLSTISSPDSGSVILLLEGAETTGLKSLSEENNRVESIAGMKRKRGPKAGHKKGKKSNPSVVKDPASAPVCVNTEDSICSDQNDVGRTNIEMDTEPPSQGADKLCSMSSVADLPNDRPTGKTAPGRVKVKLKSSRVLEPQTSYSDAQASDTARSNPQVALEMHYTAVEKEDSIYSDGQTSEMQNTVPEKIPRKVGSVKIKSSTGLSFSSDIMQDKNLNKLNNSPQMLSDRNLVPSDNKRTSDSSVPKNLRQRETKLPYRDPRYNEKALSDAQEVIQRVMKKKAARPFNAPFNPVARGIPDYSDIIVNPMDFGTICHNLERGSKYVNSEDVYKDVQFIWENCYKYNNKGDHIIDLMKRVKKKFMKYWIAAGLHSDIPSIGKPMSKKKKRKMKTENLDKVEIGKKRPVGTTSEKLAPEKKAKLISPTGKPMSKKKKRKMQTENLDKVEIGKKRPAGTASEKLPPEKKAKLISPAGGGDSEDSDEDEYPNFLPRSWRYLMEVWGHFKI